MKIDKIENQDNFGQVFNQLRDSLFWFLARLTGTKDDAKDILQDSFIKVYNYQNSGIRIDNIKSLLYKTAYNLYQDKIKRVNKYKTILANIGKTQDSQLATEDRFFFKEASERIYRGLKQLKKKERSIILLYLDAFSYKDISNIMKIKKTSVGKTLSRAIDKLDKKISNGEKNEMFK